MKKKSIKVLVIGATGKQGGHVARLLLERGHKVRALTRHADSHAARDLKEFGAEIARGDLADRDSVDRAIKGVDAIFLVTTFLESGLDAEVRQGIAVADAAKAKDKYLVFTSVASADRDTGIPHFDSKGRIERHIRDVGLDSAVVAPVYFMENVLTYTRPQLLEGLYAVALPPDRRLQQVALDDIAGYAVLALEHRDRFAGTRTDLASDELTGTQAAELLSRVLGRPISYRQVPREDVAHMSEDMAKMFDWFDRFGFSIDIPGLRAKYPEVHWHTYESWAREQNWQSILACELAGAGASRE